jgi:TonB family protein
LLTEGKIDIRPAFPAEAQARRLEGAGVFVLRVNQASGRVRSVEVEKSTGHKILDDAAVAKFTDLRFKPETVSTVRIPVEFKMPPPSDSISRTRGFPATALFQNERPAFPSSGRSVGK